jgi:putative FmdB family regulatory protein
MPTYEYFCENCKKEFSMIMSYSEHEAKEMACPECKGREIKQLVSTFVSQTRKKS